MDQRRLGLAIKQRAANANPVTAAQRLAALDYITDRPAPQSRTSTAITASAGPRPSRAAPTNNANSNPGEPASEDVSARNGGAYGDANSRAGGHDPLAELNRLLALPGHIIGITDYLNPRTSRRRPGRIARWVFDVQLPDHRGKHEDALTAGHSCLRATLRRGSIEQHQRRTGPRQAGTGGVDGHLQLTPSGSREAQRFFLQGSR